MSADKIPAPGRDLDFLVAEKLELNPVWHYPENPPFCNCKNLMYKSEVPNYDGWLEVPNYSTDWNAAGELVEYIRQTVSKFVWIDSFPAHDKWPDKWIVSINDPTDHTKRLGSGRSATAPHAICLAFLALEIEKEEQA